MMPLRIDVVQGDITQLAVDAIVNAANSSLLGGGGVDGAIHQAAGKQLLEACQRLNGCATGEAKITQGYLLPAKYVIHTVGPIWQGGRQREPILLKSCYRRVFALAAEYQLYSLAFPAISCGVYGYPHQAACAIAITETLLALKQYPQLKRVVFVCFSPEMVAIYENTLIRLKAAGVE